MHRIGFVILPGFQMMTLAAASVFEFANLEAEEDLYDIHILSETGGPVRCSAGMAVDSEKFGEESFDTLLVCAGIGIPEPSQGLIQFVHTALGSSRRLASICTGAF